MNFTVQQMLNKSKSPIKTYQDYNKFVFTPATFYNFKHLLCAIYTNLKRGYLIFHLILITHNALCSHATLNKLSVSSQHSSNSYVILLEQNFSSKKLFFRPKILK